VDTGAHLYILLILLHVLAYHAGNEDATPNYANANSTVI
jgi:hypothetical protein